jgi:hypothetical protein
MDTQKDIQKNDNLSRFLDNQGIKTNPFGHNRIGERAYRRAERLSAAIILLTNHVSENDPLRQSARTLSLSLIESLLADKDEMRSATSGKGHDVKAVVRNTISVLRLLAVAGHVSIQNAEAVTEALDGLVDFLNASQKSALADGVSITREDLVDIRDINYREQRAPERGASVQLPKKDVAASGANNELKMDVFAGLSVRSLSIIEVLRANGEMGIRDVASNLPEYSEKMIQRELADLVDSKHVRKSGLKRWSRYALT